MTSDEATEGRPTPTRVNELERENRFLRAALVHVCGWRGVEGDPDPAHRLLTPGAGQELAGPGHDPEPDCHCADAVSHGARWTNCDCKETP